MYTANLVFSSSSWAVPRFSTQFWIIWIARPTDTPSTYVSSIQHYVQLCTPTYPSIINSTTLVWTSTHLTIHTVIEPPVFLYHTSSMHNAHPLPCGSLSTGGGFHVISFPRPAGNAGKCVISLLLLSINDLINITLYYSTIAAMHLNVNHQNKSKRLYSIIW